MRRYRVQSVERVFKGFFSVYRVNVAYERADGTLSDPVERTFVERGDAVAVLIHDVELDKLIFVRQFRYPTARHNDAWPLEIVAGAIDPGESPEEAVRREALEESGYPLDSLRFGNCFYGSCGGMSEMLWVYFATARASARPTQGGGLEGEDVELIEMSPDEAIAAMDRGEIRDAKALIALNWFARQRRR